ncbi:hypothetical protein Lepto7375DRAFT_5539 [Leptolyngbya sp. PCC 7375]|nr:hypothetical protein Lepto7375DRAFT_5539 [Leptolyngbya sp. PCC 7375]
MCLPTNQIILTQEDRVFFLENGFIKLKNFLTQKSLDRQGV